MWRVVGRVVAGRWQRPATTYAKPETASAVLGSWWWAVCRPKHVELIVNMKLKILIHGCILLDFLCEVYYDARIHEYQFALSRYKIRSVIVEKRFLFLLLCLCIRIDKYALFCIFLANWQTPAILTEVFPCFFFCCKANATVYLAKTGHGPHSS